MSFNNLASSFINNTADSILSISKVILSSKFSKLTTSQKNSKILILANGPSLNQFLNNNSALNSAKNIETLCVNYFYKSDFYIKIKPEYYIVAAPELWVDGVDDNYIKNRKDLFTQIADKTTWKMKFLIPNESRKKLFWQEIIKKNKNIEVEFYNLTAIEGFKSLRYFLYDKQLGMPRSHNIVGYSIMVLLWKGYKNIGLIGVDHTWTKELFVTENNEALLAQPHFYDVNAKPEKMTKTGSGSRKLFEILEKFYLAFKAYFEIKDYSNKKQANISNLTKGSFIDAFERTTIENFLNK